MSTGWKLPQAESVPYFGTSRSSPDTWIDKAIAEIVRAGGKITSHAFGCEPHTGRSAFLVAFTIAGDAFRITWPVLPSKGNKDNAARIQAATLLYHDVKAACVKARVFGCRTAFFQHLLLPDGREAHQAGTPEFLKALPAIAAPLRIEE